MTVSLSGAAPILITRCAHRARLQENGSYPQRAYKIMMSGHQLPYTLPKSRAVEREIGDDERADQSSRPAPDVTRRANHRPPRQRSKRRALPTEPDNDMVLAQQQRGSSSYAIRALPAERVDIG